MRWMKSRTSIPSDHGPATKLRQAPAVASVLGAYALRFLDNVPPLASYTLGTSQREVTLVRLIVATIIAFFAVFDVTPRLRNLAFPKRYLPLGGLLSGFFGGLSGIQGALRAAFLVAMSGKQVAVVGPTTLLARQHFRTFEERLRGLPVRVRQLSRLVNAKEAAETRARPRSWRSWSGT